MAPKDFSFRFTSPFDPKFKGRTVVTTVNVTPEQTATEVARRDLERMNTPADRFYDGGFSSGPSRRSALADAIMASSFAALEARIMSGFTEKMTGELTGEQATRPSYAYRQARDAVKSWIVAAPEQEFDDIVSNDDALAQLKDAITAPVLHKELYEAYGLKMPKGALLSGPPGCGKTMFAKAAVSEMKKLYGSATEFISISGSSLQSGYVGETETRIRQIFAFAREYKAFHGHPLLVFIDEADALFPDRTGRTRHVAPWEESRVATFLAEMDGMQESGAFVLLATNRPEAIDEAVLRDGRCDFKITVKRPTRQAVELILRKSFEALPVRGAGVADLTFAAVEALYDPAYVILPFGALEIDPAGKKVRKLSGKDFALEHVLSGALVASIAGRASRLAFARDKASATLDGQARGVTVDNVLSAVKAVFEENRELPHAFAVREFLESYAEEAKEESEAYKKKGMN